MSGRRDWTSKADSARPRTDGPLFSQIHHDAASSASPRLSNASGNHSRGPRAEAATASRSTGWDGRPESRRGSHCHCPFRSSCCWCPARQRRHHSRRGPRDLPLHSPLTAARSTPPPDRPQTQGQRQMCRFHPGSAFRGQRPKPSPTPGFTDSDKADIQGGATAGFESRTWTV